MAQQHDVNAVLPATAADKASPAPMVERGRYVWPTPIVATDLHSLHESVIRAPVVDCIGEVDQSTWIIAGRLLLKHHPEATTPPPGTSWSAGRHWGGYYTLEDAPQPLPKAYPVDESGPQRRFEMRYVDHVKAVIGIGSVLLKIQIVRPHFPHAAREHAILNWLAERKESFSFEFPEVVAHYVLDGRYYLFITDLVNELGLHEMGERRENSMTGQQKKAAADRVTAICHELAAFKSTCGRSHVPLTGPPVFCDPPKALTCSRGELGLDCSERVFAHNGLSWGSVLLDDDNKVAGIIHWDVAAFVPREWALQSRGNRLDESA
ncbi:hypothetical protein RB595_001617 [Gaeumannomyces hyphopodioides]